MNRTTATCIAGMRSKTASRSRIHFQRRLDFRFFAFRVKGFASLGVGIRQETRWRPECNPLYFKLGECSESVIVVRLTGDPHDFSPLVTGHSFLSWNGANGTSDIEHVAIGNRAGRRQRS